MALVAFFIWGALFWSSPIPYKVAKATADDSAAGRMLKEYFPESGVYFLPGQYNDRPTIEKLMMSGPLATLHIRHQGMKPMEPKYMIVGIIHELIVVILMAMLMKMVVRALPGYWNRAGFAALAGFTASFFSELTNPVWWSHPLPWYLMTGFYYFTCWLIIGFILAAFIKPESQGA